MIMVAQKQSSILMAVGGLLLYAGFSINAAPPDEFNAEDPAIYVMTVTNQASNTLPAKVSAHARFVTLRPAEVKEVYRFDKKTGTKAQAFFLPTEATELVQLIVEQKGGLTTYFLKGIRAGKTVGGVVQRDWLDKKGFAANNETNLGRIQQAVKAQPYLITVEP